MGKEFVVILVRENIPYHREHFIPCRMSGTTFLKSLVKVAFVDKIIRGNITCNSFYQLVAIMGKYLPQKGKVRVRHMLFCGPFPFEGDIAPYCVGILFEHKS